MIKEHARPSDSFRQYLDFLASDGQFEATADGFDYTVYDPEKAGGERFDTLFVGHQVLSADTIEMDVFISGSVPSHTRKKLAEIAVVNADRFGRYSLPYSADEVLGLLPDSNIPPYEEAGEVLRYMTRHLEAQKAGIARRRQNGDTPPPTFVDAVRSAVGWVNFRRPLTEDASELYDDFTKAGLVVPDFESEQRVVGVMRTKRGTVQAGFVGMTERSERHTCASCSGQILKNTQRMTLQIDDARQHYDHHHYHWPCFIEKILPKFQIESLALDVNPAAQT